MLSRFGRKRAYEDEEAAGIVELFGGLLAIFLLILIFVATRGVEIRSRALIDPPESGEFRLNWTNQEFDGIVLVLQEGLLTVVSTNQQLPEGKICDDPNFQKYAHNVYVKGSIFLLYILEGGVRIAREVRDCLEFVLNDRERAKIYFLVADREIVKIRPEDDIDATLDSYFSRNRQAADEADRKKK